MKSTQIDSKQAVPLKQHTGSVRSLLRWSYLYATLLFVVCIIVQVFLAGAGILVNGSWLVLHTHFGYIIHFFPLVILLPLSIAAWLPRSINWLTALLTILTFIQPLLITLSPKLNVPLLPALHPVNALLIFTLPLFLSYRVWQIKRNEGR